MIRVMILAYFLWFFVFLKLLLFWLWLWQLKEYHWGRFRAHFETQAFKKILSSLWRLRYPKFTFKASAILAACLILEFFLLFSFGLFSVIILTLVLLPLLVFCAQVITAIWRSFVIAEAAKKRSEMKSLLTIGITGSFGKTSTKEFLATILGEKFSSEKVLKTKEHQNSEIGVSLCILNDLKQKHEIFICEMGAYKKGGIKLLADIVRPKIGVVTGVNEQHLSTFGSMENLLSSEGGKELIDSLPEDGMAFFNAKNEHCRTLYEATTIKKFLYGEEAKNFSEENLLGAMTVAKELGMTDKEIAKAAGKIPNKLPGINIKTSSLRITVIDASYSANPTGVLAHLEYLKTLRQAQGKLVIVMPCLIELGSASAEIHRRVGQKITQVCDLAIITTNDRFDEIRETAGEKAELLERADEIFAKIKSFCREGDTVLLEGRVPDKLIQQLTINNESV
ncbi:MAG: hypothetical protein G01um101430_208 [Parcubacteria group bacterium Gr01-1014_30]|nr:MAG: hypothetical protein G01um101430_208 [Parcubacteria group bacterium Gr01-1014_30]